MKKLLTILIVVMLGMVVFNVTKVNGQTYELDIMANSEMVKSESKVYKTLPMKVVKVIQKNNNNKIIFCENKIYLGVDDSVYTEEFVHSGREVMNFKFSKPFDMSPQNFADVVVGAEQNLKITLNKNKCSDFTVKKVLLRYCPSEGGICEVIIYFDTSK